MKYLQPIAEAFGFRIQKGTSDGYSGYRLINGRTGLSVGVFFDSLDSVAEYLAAKVRKEGHGWLAARKQ